MRIWPAPSMRAASSSSSGIDLKDVRVIMILNTESAVGRMIAARVFSMPRVRTTMYVGMIPPLNIIVKVKNRAIGLPSIRFRDRP